MSTHFDLTRNPFHTLNLSIRANRQEVGECFEEMLADNQFDEEKLILAQQIVLTPLSRLAAELSWFPGLPPLQAKEIVTSLETSNLQVVIKVMDRLLGVDKANLAADLCERSPGDINFVIELLDSYKSISSQDVYNTIKNLRNVSCFRIPTDKQFKEALTSLRENHAKAAVTCIIATKEPGIELTNIVEKYLNLNDKSVDILLNLVVSGYDAWSQSSLAKIKENIENTILNCKSYKIDVDVYRFVDLLEKWDAINQPVQLYDESKGHEEPQSQQIYRIIRDFCIWLVKSNKQYAKALEISRALANTFPELRVAAEQLDRDIKQLEGLIEVEKIEEAINNLIELQETIKKYIMEFKSDIINSGFGFNSKELSRKLYQTFENTLKIVKNTELEERPWWIVRSIAIKLNNDHNSPESASIILEGLLSYNVVSPSKKVCDKINEDLLIIKRRLSWKELKRVRNIPKKGIIIATSLLDDATEDEYIQLREIIHDLKVKRVFKNIKHAFVGLVVTGILAIIVYEEVNETSQNSQPSFSTINQNNSNYPQMSNSSSAMNYDEQIPPIGMDLKLNERQVRYCVFQKQRLSVIKKELKNNSEVDYFNELVYDYNNRCSRFRYYPGVLTFVKEQMLINGSQLRVDAWRILSTWRNILETTTYHKNTVLLDLQTGYDAFIVQRRLKQLGYYHGSIDGRWGPQSKDALRKYKETKQHIFFGDIDSWDLLTQNTLMGY